MKRPAILLILLLLGVPGFVPTPDADHYGAALETEVTLTSFGTREQIVSLENFSYRPIDPGTPFTITHIGDIDDDSDPDLIGYNSTHNLLIDYDVKTDTFTIEPYGNRSELYLPRYMKLIDLDGNNRLNAMANNYSLFEWENGKFILTRTNGIGKTIHPSYGDVDSDGDIDILHGGRPDGIYIVRNVNNGTFDYETTDRTGLPEFTGVPSRDYLALAYMYEDINNDGWLDICTGMGDYTERYPGQDYFWLSNGDGTWEEFSDGCPTWDHGVSYVNMIDSSDFDNDGDQDFLINLKYNRTTIFKNNYPDDWELYHLPRSDALSGFTDSYHKVGDMNNDGYDDIVLSYSKHVLDSNGNVIGYRYKIGVLYNQGNFSFEYHLSNELDINGLDILTLTDIDQDGSLDIIINPTNPETDGWSSFVLFNDHVSENELELYPSWGSTVLRSGSYWGFDLLSNRKDQYSGMDVSFNISISYFGVNGPYSPLIVNLSKWWTYWTVPDFPSNNAYLLIEGMNMSTKYGPFTIYSRNDSKYLITPSFSVSGSHLYCGREVSVLLEPDPNLLAPVSLALIVEHSNGTIDLGSHVVYPGSVTSFRWTVPVDLFEPDCRFIQHYLFEGHDVLVRGDEGYNILDDEHFLEEVRGNNTLLTWRGYTSVLNITCMSKDMTDLTHSSRFDITTKSEYFNVFHAGDGLFHVYGLSLGSDWLRVDIDCFGVKKSFSSYITVERSVGTLTLSGDAGEARTGDEKKIDLSARDLLGFTVDLVSDDVEWTLSGPGTILLSASDHIDILCNGTGTVLVEVVSDVGYGPVGDMFSFEVLPLIHDVGLSASGPVVVGREIEITANVHDHEGGLLSDHALSWNVSGNASWHTDNGSLMLVPHDDDQIRIDIETVYFDEFQVWSYFLYANLSLTGITLSYRTLFIALYSTEYIEVSPLTCNGSEYPFDVTIELIKENPAIISHRMDGNRITLIGQELGTTSIEFRVSSPYEFVSDILTITVFDVPSDVLVHSRKDIVRDIEYRLDFDVISGSGSTLLPSSYGSYIENATLSGIDDKWSIRPLECGIFTVKFHVAVHDIELVRSFDFEVYPLWSSMYLHTDPVHVRKGEDVLVRPYLVLEDGSESELNDISVETDRDIDVEMGKNDLVICCSFPTTLTITVSGYYMGLPVEDVFEIDVLETAVLTEISVLFHNSTDRTIVEVIAHDQYGIDISDLCTFDFIGDVGLVSNNTVEVSGNRLTVKVSLFDVEITRDILGSGSRDHFLFERSIPVFLASILVIAVVVFFTLRRYVFDAPRQDGDTPVPSEE